MEGFYKLSSNNIILLFAITFTAALHLYNIASHLANLLDIYFIVFRSGE
jgi:hypothetical protein